MNTNSKVKCYRDIYAYLKEDSNIMGLGFPPQEQRKHYDIFFDIGVLHVDYRLRNDKDLLLIRVSKDIPDWMDETDARVFCKNALNSNNYRWFAENGKLSGSYTLPLFGMSEEKAQKAADEGARGFIQYLEANKDKVAAFFTKPAPVDTITPTSEEQTENDSIPMPEIEVSAPDTAVVGMEDSFPAADGMDDGVIQKNEKIVSENPSITCPEEENVSDKEVDKPALTVPVSQDLSDDSQPSDHYGDKSDFEKFCSDQIADIERRQQLVKKMEKAVDDKIADYKKMNKSLMRLKEDVLAIKAKNEKDAADIAERNVLTQELDNKNQMIAILQENIEAKEKEMKRSHFFSGFNANEEIDKKKLESYEKELQEAKDTIRRLQEESSELRAESSGLKAENQKLQELYASAQSSADKTMDDLLKSQEKVKLMETRMLDSSRHIDELEQAQFETVKPIEIEEFEKAGFSVKEIVGERDGLYRLSAASDSVLPDGISVAVDVVHRIALLQKNVRRGKKYLSTVNSWNDDDLWAAYQMSNDRIIVKKFLCNKDAVSDLEDVINRMDSLQ